IVLLRHGMVAAVAQRVVVQVLAGLPEAFLLLVPGEPFQASIDGRLGRLASAVASHHEFSPAAGALSKAAVARARARTDARAHAASPAAARALAPGPRHPAHADHRLHQTIFRGAG